MSATQMGVVRHEVVMVKRPALARRSNRERRRLDHRRFVLISTAFVLLLAGVQASCLSDVVIPPPCPVGMDCESSAGTSAGSAGDGGGASATAVSAGDGGSARDAAGSAGDGGEGAVCESCRITPPRIQDPCGNAHYAEPIYVIDGTPPYRWAVTSTTGSWHIEDQPNSVDGSEAVLVGDPAGPTTLTITVTDAVDLVSRRTVTLIPRTACYFAYVYSEANQGKLALVDPLLPHAAEPDLANDVGVNDFRFSPNGRYLAYRYGKDAQHPSGAHLSLFDFSTMHDQSLDFADEAVTAYEWSPDSAVLAVALKSQEKSQLSGIRPTSTATATTLHQFSPLDLTDAVESDLYWVGSEFVGFHSPGPMGSDHQMVSYARLTTNAFATPKTIPDITYRPPLVVAPSPGGLFVTGVGSSSAFFSIALDNTSAIPHGSNFIDPGGTSSARIVGNELQVFRARDGAHVIEASSPAPQSSCPKLLTWASKRERIACVATVSESSATWGQLRIFDLGTGTGTALEPSPVKGSCLKDLDGGPLGGECSITEYDYDETSSEAQPRLLSPNGDWLAFITGAQSGDASYLYWADLRSKPMKLRRRFEPGPSTTTTPVALEFSPSGRYLMNQNGTQLQVHLLDADTIDGEDHTMDQPLDAATSAPCSEDFVSAPTRWCGGRAVSPPFTWSPDAAAELFAYRTSGQLIVVQLSPTSFLPMKPFLHAPACSDFCSGQFAFQPPLP